MPEPYDLNAYRRHAERFGPECVFETAMCDLSAVPLGRLSLHLQRIDPEWRPRGARSVGVRLSAHRGGRST